MSEGGRREKNGEREGSDGRGKKERWGVGIGREGRREREVYKMKGKYERGGRGGYKSEEKN